MQFFARLGDVGLNCNFGLEEMLQCNLFLWSEILTTQEEPSINCDFNDVCRRLLCVLKSFNFENETINPSEEGIVSEFIKELLEFS